MQITSLKTDYFKSSSDIQRTLSLSTTSAAYISSSGQAGYRVLHEIRKYKMLNINTFSKAALIQSIHNTRTCCRYSTLWLNVLLFVFCFLLPYTFPPCAALELCGGIRGRFVCDDQDPALFHICLGNNQYTMVCPGTLHFNARTQNCDWPKNVNCVQEAMSRNVSKGFSPNSTALPVERDPLVDKKGTSSPLRDISTSSSTSSPLRDISTSSSTSSPLRDISTSLSTSSPVKSFTTTTESSVVATELPSQETTDSEAHSRYRLKLVPGADKPLESLIPADEKVIEEVKTLSEELKHIENYLQSLESEQIGFMIEPYMAKHVQRSRPPTSRYQPKASWEHTTPFFNPYRKIRALTENKKRRNISASPYRMNIPNYGRSLSENNHRTKKDTTMALSELTTASRYKPIAKLYNAKTNTSTSYRWYPALRSALFYNNFFSNIESRKNSLINKRVSPYQNSWRINDISNSNSRRIETRINIKNKKINSSPDIAGSRDARVMTRSHTSKRFDPVLNREYHNIRQFQDDRSRRYHKIKNPTQQTDSPQKNTGRLHSSNTITRKDGAQSRQISYNKTFAKTIYPGRGIASRRTGDLKEVDTTHMTWSSTQRSQRTPTNIPDPTASNIPAKRATSWSTTRSVTVSPAVPGISKSTTKTDPAGFVYSSRLHGPINDGISTTVSSLSSSWYSTQDYKSTKPPHLSKRLNRNKDEQIEYFQKPDYNTRTPFSDFALAPANKKSTSFMSILKEDRQSYQPVNAPAAIGRNFALHGLDIKPATEDRGFSLYQSNPTSEDRSFSLYQSNPTSEDRSFSLYQINPSSEDRSFSLYQINPASEDRSFSLYQVSSVSEDTDFPLYQINKPASSDSAHALHTEVEKEQSKVKASTNTEKIAELKSYSNSEDLISPYKSPVEKYDMKKGKCSNSWCKLPECRCIGSDIPGDLDVKDVPQMVMLTFDDSINSQNMHYFKGIFNGTLKNPNGCPIKSTFFVSGDNSDYQMVRTIYKQGHEIASHTLSHRDPTTWWAYAGYDNWESEIVGMRQRLNEKSGVPVNEITGMRAPFLQVGGDDQYAMLKENKFRYDSSMVTGNLYFNNKPPIWPFTLDTPPDSITCSLTPCPKRSFAGLWEVPLVRWYGSNKIACAMPDACTIDLGTKGSLKFIEDNFKRHYTTNRAPFGIFIHATWFGRKDGNLQGLVEFLASLADKEDVWVVTVNQALDWIQHPVKLSALNSIESWAC